MSKYSCRYVSHFDSVSSVLLHLKYKIEKIIQNKLKLKIYLMNYKIPLDKNIKNIIVGLGKYIHIKFFFF